MSKNNASENHTQFMPIGMCLGISIGLAIGSAMDNLSAGMCAGLGIGMCVGSLIDAANRKEARNSQPEKPEAEASSDTPKH